MSSAFIAIPLLLAAILGFSAHRASICTVKAVAEVLTTRRGFMLVSFAKTIMWVMAITFVLVWLLPGARTPGPQWATSFRGVGGGFIFGVGAVLNRGCAFSTLIRLGDGKLGMLVSLFGFCLGVGGYASLRTSLHLPPSEVAPAIFDATGPWTLVLAVGLGLWMIWEAGRLWRTWPTESTWKTRLLAKRYRLSTAAALMGLSNGVLYALVGTWAYTSTLDRATKQLIGMDPGPSAMLWALLVAALTGVGFSSLQSGRFRCEWRPSASWGGYLVGGGLMGFGAAMIPGGNDVLLLHAIPGLSPHALPAYAAMVAGIGLALIVMRGLGREVLQVDCRGDICSS